jgi:hypothetical protein
VGNKRVHDAFDNLSQAYRANMSVLTEDQFVDCVKIQSTKSNDRMPSATGTIPAVPHHSKENIPPPRAPFVGKVHFSDLETGQADTGAPQPLAGFGKEEDRRFRFHDGVFPSFERVHGSPESAPPSYTGADAQGSAGSSLNDDEDDESGTFGDEEEAEIDDEAEVVARLEPASRQPVSLFPGEDVLLNRKRVAFEPQALQLKQAQDDGSPSATRDLNGEYYSAAPNAYSIPKSMRATQLPAPEIYQFRKAAADQASAPGRMQQIAAAAPRNRAAPAEYVDLSGLTSEVIIRRRLSPYIHSLFNCVTLFRFTENS